MFSDPAAPVVEALVASVLADFVGRGLRSICVSRAVGDDYGERVYASDQRAMRLEDLQQLVGEGPGVTCLRQRGPVLVPDICAERFLAEWMTFGREADAIGVRAVFAFPIQVGAARIGLVTWSSSEPVVLDEGAIQSLLQLADLLSLALLSSTVDGHLEDWVEEVLGFREAVTQQAVGMVSAQLGSTLEDALAVLRAHAYTQQQTLVGLARAVVGRRVSFGPLSAEGPSEPPDVLDGGLHDD